MTWSEIGRRALESTKRDKECAAPSSEDNRCIPHGTRLMGGRHVNDMLTAFKPMKIFRFWLWRKRGIQVLHRLFLFSSLPFTLRLPAFALV